MAHTPNRGDRGKAGHYSSEGGCGLAILADLDMCCSDCEVCALLMAGGDDLTSVVRRQLGKGES